MYVAQSWHVSAININGKTDKQILTETHQLIQYFDVGVQEEGYWSHDNIFLQNEDAYDVLSVLYPNHDIVILMDQSTGHRKRSEDALHSHSMSAKYGGSQPQMHPTIIQELGPYPSTLSIGDKQHMTFRTRYSSTFYMKDAKSFKYDVETGKRVTSKKTKCQLLE